METVKTPWYSKAVAKKLPFDGYTAMQNGNLGRVNWYPGCTAEEAEEDGCEPVAEEPHWWFEELGPNYTRVRYQGGFSTEQEAKTALHQGAAKA